MSITTVIIPTKDNESSIEGCLDSLINQDGDFEYIISDYGSEDSTLEIARNYEGAQVITGALNYAEAVNSSLEKANGDFVTILSPEDMLLPESIKSRAAVLEQFDEANIVATDSIMTRSRQNIVLPDDSAKLKDVLFITDVLTDSTVMVRKSILRSNPLDFVDDGIELWALWLKLAKDNVIYRIPGVYVWGKPFEVHVEPEEMDSKELSKTFSKIFAYWNISADSTIWANAITGGDATGLYEVLKEMKLADIDTDFLVDVIKRRNGE